ncbi:MAG TPA: endolytic transglycosylase MltG [Paenibacillus sp.]|uniref:endolytic transglycosylase MltG n=1 Tax=Paenibacillus sp. TaxID=58172 RepID=UPI0028D01FA3|nr:endolytic transglycosylase MltG [Paenibacillus sp.]HUC91362.1 endolytic transglycosylase MltG [Paenibacillus sp.]
MPDGMQADGQALTGAGGPPSSKSRMTLRLILTLLALVLAASAAVALFVWNGLRPAPDGDTVGVEVPRGSSPFAVADLLEEKGVIRNAFIFKYYLRYRNEGAGFQAGQYEMKPGMTHDEIIAKLNAGDTVKAETIRFTIPEGFTLLQIADKLQAESLIDKDKFLKLADNPDAYRWEGIMGGIPENANIRHRMEGYLFPETYEMDKESTEEDILARMLAELDNKLSQLPEGWEGRLNELGLTFHEMMTVASLVEREVVVAEERPLVAGVIYNRIKEKMPLQIDATVQYALDKPKERLYEKDLQVESPYNTYQIPGLPPGPIANPSLSSIKAALYPEQTDYFYYVTKKDGTQTHLFARTYEEHLKNIRKSNQTAEKGGYAGGGN